MKQFHSFPSLFFFLWGYTVSTMHTTTYFFAIPLSQFTTLPQIFLTEPEWREIRLISLMAISGSFSIKFLMEWKQHILREKKTTKKYWTPSKVLHQKHPVNILSVKLCVRWMENSGFTLGLFEESSTWLMVQVNFFFTEVLGSYRVSLEKSARGYNSAEETLLLVLKRQGGLPVWRESGNRQEVILFQKEKNKLVLNFDQKFWSKVSGWNTSKDGRGTSIQALLNSWKGCLENDKMCLCGETSNSFEVAIKVRCAKKII